MAAVTTLWRPVGHAELDLVAASGWRRFPPRLPGQPIFYPVLNEGYACRIAREWNTKDAASGFVGHVLRFDVDGAYAAQFPPHRVGGAGIDELWIPAERLEEFNDHIVGEIGLVATYHVEPQTAVAALRALAGRDVQVSVHVVPPYAGLADSFVETQPMWEVAQFTGRVEHVRDSSRPGRWYVEFADSAGATSFDVDGAAFAWAVVRPESLTVRQGQVAVHVDVTPG